MGGGPVAGYSLDVDGKDRNCRPSDRQHYAMDHLLMICRTTLTSELAATALPQVAQNAVPFTTTVAGLLQSRIGRMLPSAPLVPRSMATSDAAHCGPLLPIR